MEHQWSVSSRPTYTKRTRWECLRCGRTVFSRSMPRAKNGVVTVNYGSESVDLDADCARVIAGQVHDA